MPSSQVDICNLALAKLAQDVTIASLTERSKEARTFARLWEPMSDMVLASREWQFATTAVALALDPEDPIPGWQYRYTRPSDCLRVVALTDENGMRAGRRLSAWCHDEFRDRFAIEYQTVTGAQSTAFMCDAEQAYLVYVTRIEDTARFPAHFVEALACKLAEEAAPSIIGDRGLQQKGQLRQAYSLALSEAAAIDSNESEGHRRGMSAAQAARN